MGFFSQRIERSELKAGDHIYTWRAAFTYSHHGIYVGENRVVHFTQDCNFGFASTSTSTFTSTSTTSSSHFSSCSTTQTPCLGLNCGFKKEGSEVVISCLNCFLGNGSLRRFEYGVGSATFFAKFRGGTCAMAESSPPETVVYRAMYLLYKGFGKYDVMANNCEDFALYCKTGNMVCERYRRQFLRKKKEFLGSSGQATSVASVPFAAFIAKLIVSGPVGMATTAAVTYSLNRYVNDMGVSTYVVPVKVEDVEMFQKDTSWAARSERLQKRS